MGNWTPGPWNWFGQADRGFYLATEHSGRRFVMQFRRMGMQFAQPVFQVRDHGMVRAQELVRFEVDPSVVGLTAGKTAPSVYRYDICGIDHPDARLIAAAPDLLEALDGMLEIAALAMPDTYFATDKRVFAAHAAIAKAKGET